MLRARPACPRHPRSRVWFDGTYGRGERQRQRYKCLPVDGDPAHVFTEELPRTIDVDGECLECERPLAAHEGPPAPRAFEYTVREIAEQLAAQGGRGSLRLMPPPRRAIAPTPTSTSYPADPEADDIPF